MVVEVSGHVAKEGTNVGLHPLNDGIHQRWAIRYLDQTKKEPTSGLNRDFGFWINRPFYIISRLPMKRALEIVGGRNMVIRSKVFGRRTQQFVFDIKSKTVKSVAYMDRSLDIANAGRSSNL